MTNEDILKTDEKPNTCFSHAAAMRPYVRRAIYALSFHAMMSVIAESHKALGPSLCGSLQTCRGWEVWPGRICCASSASCEIS